MNYLATFGRFHLLLLHLPIGLIVAVATLELVSLRARGKSLVETAAARAMQRVLMWLMALSASAAAGTGYVLSLEPGYKGPTVSLHMWLGISVAALSMLTLIAHETTLRASRVGGSAAPRLGLFRIGLLLTVILVVPTGHFGGTLTHGEDFLFVTSEPRRSAGTAAAPGSDPAADQSEFGLKVQPILAANCYACHGESKQKGDLALHTQRDILAGGKHGAVIDAGNAAGSELVQRLRLPLDDDDHMPPKGKPQPLEEQVRAIEAWIAGGALFKEEASAEGGRVRSTTHDQGRNTAGQHADARIANAPAPDALGALREALVHVQVVEPGSTMLWVDFAAPAGAGAVSDERVAALLKPLMENIEDLSLARSGITDQVAPTLAGLKNLKHLDLSRTAITDAGLTQLGQLTGLEQLNLVGTSITDASLPFIEALPKLNRLFAWGTKLTPSAIERIRTDRPSLAVEAGDALTGKPIEVEAAPKLVKGGVAPAPPAGATKAGPVNTRCPVTGDAVDPRYVIVYEGRQIGFCCLDCPKKFWLNPDNYIKNLPK